MNILDQMEYELFTLERKPNKNVHTEIIDKKSLEVLNDIEKNHNTAWSIFMFERNKKSKALDKTAILYRGNKITYKEMYIKAFEFAKSLKELGMQKGDSLPICISNIPEYIYINIACNLAGIKPHFFGSYFDADYIEQLINDSNSKTVFVSEDKYKDIKDSIENTDINNIILVSLEDSLLKIDNKPINPYQHLEPNHIFNTEIDKYKNKSNKNILSENEFINIGKRYKGRVIAEQTLDDDATIAYTSGTTRKNRPKAVIHSNRVYTSVSRFKSSDVSKMPEMKNLVTMFNVPVYSHTNLSNITDTLFCNCTYACEPFNELDFYIKSLLINKPNYVQSTIGHWLYLGKELLKKENSKIKFPFLMLPDVVGEGCSPGEEKFLNKTAREHSFGTAKLPFPLAPVTFALGGGTCETGGLFFTIFHELRNKLFKIKNRKYSLGLLPVKMAEFNVINLNGEYCKVNELGFLVVNSAASMSGYLDESLNKDVYITDKYGKKWMKMGAIGCIAEPYNRSVKIKGRASDYTILKDGTFFPTCIITDVIDKDTKNILSCSVIKNDDCTYVCHIEKQPESTRSIENILISCKERLYNELPAEIISKISFRVRSNKEGFPLDKSGKRSLTQLKEDSLNANLIHIEDIGSDKEKNDVKTKSLKKDSSYILEPKK